MSNTARVQDTLGLRKPPIAIGFFDEPPAGVPAWDGGPVPSGCTFWRAAQDGKRFYTVPSDHHNCAVGSYTHRMELPPERAGELEETIGLMVESGYLEMSEVPGIPQLGQAPRVVAYGPAEAAGFRPDVVLLVARPAQAMLIYEAALRAGAGNAVANLMGRPGCGALPLTLDTGTAAMSFGCMGSRLYTGVPDDELYITIPGDRWEDVADRLVGIQEANRKMAAFYEDRRRRVAAGQG